jgi:hypothetical protein
MMIGTEERVRIWRQTSVPERPGSRTVEFGYRLSPRVSYGYLETLFLQKENERFGKRCFIFDDQNPGHEVASC